MAPLPIRLWPRKFREPDVVFVARGRGEVGGYPDGADLVMEVVSPGAEEQRRDLEIKPDEYSRAGIAECWAVEPAAERVLVHQLQGTRYRVCEFRGNDLIISETLPGFEVPVHEIMASAQGT